MCMMLGGRAAEDIFFSSVSSGAQNDLERVTRLAYNQVTLYGMNERIGKVSFPPSDQAEFEKPYGEETARMIDEEAQKTVRKAYDQTLALLKSNSSKLEQVAHLLLDKEIISGEDIRGIMGPRPYGNEFNRD